MEAMASYNKGDARRIEHSVKVHDFAATVGTLEGLASQDLFILEAAAILHDIGIHVCVLEHGGDSGKKQELYGPAEAVKIMEELGCFSKEEMEGVCFLIAHHHTYEGVSSLSWQILLEADFFVNLYESAAPEEEILCVEQKMIKTATGKRIFSSLFYDSAKQKQEGLQFSRKDDFILRPRHNPSQKS